ncbi:uncharacterized protein LOC130430311 isoform X2 [Triplophysa dalaica]|uniref:uncharacterized protein LOC130430311 isoform X2 n=1 Tax=Triplophysa dalaica TaxID=1582913 RepID=UPI0024DFC303|nr:uncharacterized protein LOC130430311 isoform X2 [Triplophysa dalaica]
MFHTLLVLCFCSCLIGLFGDEVKSVSVMEGESVTLHTDVTHRQTHVEIEWRFGVNGPVIARIKRSVNINPTYNETIEIFRERLKMNNQTGDLTITNITSQHSGLYRINIPGEQKDTIKRFNLTVNADVHTEGGTHLVYIIPLSCAAVGCVMILSALLMFFIRRKHTNTRQQQQQQPQQVTDQTREDQITYADPTFYKQHAQNRRGQEEDDVVYAGVVTRR